MPPPMVHGHVQCLVGGIGNGARRRKFLVFLAFSKQFLLSLSTKASERVHSVPTHVSHPLIYIKIYKYPKQINFPLYTKLKPAPLVSG